MCFFSFTFSYSATNDEYWQFRVTRNGTAVNIGDADGSRTRVAFGVYAAGAVPSGIPAGVVSFLDSPSTTSAVSYVLQARSDGGKAGFINRASSDGDSSARFRGASNVILMEVAG